MAKLKTQMTRRQLNPPKRYREAKSCASCIYGDELPANEHFVEGRYYCKRDWRLGNDWVSRWGNRVCDGHKEAK